MHPCSIQSTTSDISWNIRSNSQSGHVAIRSDASTHITAFSAEAPWHIDSPPFKCTRKWVRFLVKIVHAYFLTSHPGSIPLWLKLGTCDLLNFNHVLILYCLLEQELLVLVVSTSSNICTWVFLHWVCPSLVICSQIPSVSVCSTSACNHSKVNHLNKLTTLSIFTTLYDSQNI